MVASDYEWIWDILFVSYCVGVDGDRTSADDSARHAAVHLPNRAYRISAGISGVCTASKRERNY